MKIGSKFFAVFVLSFLVMNTVYADVDCTMPAGWASLNEHINVLNNAETAHYYDPGFKAHILMTANPPLVPNSTLDSAVSEAKANFETIIEEKKTTFLGVDSRTMEFIQDYSDTVNKTRAYLFMLNGKLHSIMYSAEEDYFEQFLPIFNGFLDSCVVRE